MQWIASSNPFRASRAQKGRGRTNLLCSPALEATAVLLVLGLLNSDWGITLTAPLVLRPLDSDWIIPLTVLSLQLVDGILWHILASITMWANSHNRYPLIYFYVSSWVSQVVLVVKNTPANAGDLRDKVWSLGWEEPLEEGMATYSSIFAWRIPCTEEPGGL